MTVFGQNDYASLTDGILLQSIDASHYFPFLSLQGNDPMEKYTARPSYYTHEKVYQDEWTKETRFVEKTRDGPLVVEVEDIKQSPTTLKEQLEFSRLMEPESKKERRHFKIAYLVLAHENFAALVRMLQAVYSKQGLFLIHVDKNSPKLQEDVKKWIAQNRNDIGDADNIHIFTNPFALQWGSTSIVVAQLEGFYRLLDLAEWDYVINLSAYDYPLLSTDAIHKILEVCLLDF